MRVLYFAWVRSKIGLAEQEVWPPPEVDDVGRLIAWLRTLSPAHADALADASVVRVAVNQDYARAQDRVGPGDEVALFPPVTGG